MKRTAIGVSILILTSIRPEVSKAQVSKDSLAIIKRFTTASGGGGLEYRYLDTYVFKQKQKESTTTDTMTVVMADNHNSRTEIGARGMQVIGHGDMPGFSILVFPQNKTFRLNIIDTAAINGSKEMYKVSKLGEENVQGYHCIHAKLTMSYGQGLDVTEDLWVSKDVPGYTAFKKLAAMQQVTPKMLAALDQAGCEGLFVKIQTQTTTLSMSTLLVSADRQNFPGSFFQIPEGYVATNNRAGLPMAK